MVTISNDKYIITFDIHCPVLNLPALDDVVDGSVRRHVGDLGDVGKPPDILKEDEELSICDRIE